MMKKVLMPLTVALAATPVVLAAETDDKVMTIDESSTKLKPSQFPLYGAPEKPELVYIPEGKTAFRNQVSEVRQVVWKYADSFSETAEKAKKQYAGVKKYTNETLVYIQEDTGVLQRAGIITVAGLGGVIAAYRGGYIRKALFAGTGMVTAAAICYPNQAVDISSRGWTDAKAQVMDLWKTSKTHTASLPTPAPEKVEKKSEEKIKDLTTSIEASGTKIELGKEKMDFGQSKSEDKDMYTTRGS